MSFFRNNQNKGSGKPSSTTAAPPPFKRTEAPLIGRKQPMNGPPPLKKTGNVGFNKQNPTKERLNRKSVYNPKRRQLLSTKLAEVLAEDELERLDLEVEELFREISSESTLQLPPAQDTESDSYLASDFMFALPPTAKISASSPNMALEELVETERSYVRDLGLIIDKFITPLRTKQILPPSDINQIFTNIEVLLTINLSLSKKLDSANNDVAKVCQCFTSEKENLENSYSSYLNYQGTADERLKNARKNSKQFDAFLREAKKDPACRSLDVVDFLLIPLQRITKYPLLFESIKGSLPSNSPDLPIVTETAQLAAEMVAKINKGRRVYETKNKIGEILKNVSGAAEIFTNNVNLDSRIFVRSGTLESIKRTKTGVVEKNQVQCWLFTDLLIFAKKSKRFAKESYELRGVIPLFKMVFKDLVDNASFKYSWSLTRIEPDRTYIFSCPSQQSKLTWLQAITEALDHETSFEDENEEEQFSRYIRMIELSLNLDGYEKLPKFNQKSGQDISSKSVIGELDNIKPRPRFDVSNFRLIQMEGPLFSQNNIVAQNTRGRVGGFTMGLYCFLCTDVFIFTTLGKGGRYILKGFIPLDAALVVSGDDGKFYSFEIVSFDQKTKLQLGASTLDKKNRWILALDELISTYHDSRTSTTPNEKSTFFRAARQSYATMVRGSTTSDLQTKPSPNSNVNPAHNLNQKSLEELQKMLKPISLELTQPTTAQTAPASPKGVAVGQHHLKSSYSTGKLLSPASAHGSVAARGTPLSPRPFVNNNTFSPVQPATEKPDKMAPALQELLDNVDLLKTKIGAQQKVKWGQKTPIEVDAVHEKLLQLAQEIKLLSNTL